MAGPDTRVERVTLDALSPHPRNAREGDVGAITTSLQEFGQYRPIVVQEATPDGEPRMVILAGTHTWLAAREAGLDTIEAKMLTVDDRTALRIMLADNRTHDLGHDREDDLARLLEDIARQDGLVGTGWDGDDVDRLLVDTGLLADRVGAGIADLLSPEPEPSTAVQEEPVITRDGERYVRLSFTVATADRDTIITGLRAAAVRLGTSTQAETLVALLRQEAKP